MDRTAAKSMFTDTSRLIGPDTDGGDTTDYHSSSDYVAPTVGSYTTPQWKYMDTVTGYDTIQYKETSDGV